MPDREEVVSRLKDAGEAYRAYIEVGGVVLLLLAGVFLYVGVWPPFVSVQSGSMEPGIQTGDLVIVQGVGNGAGEGPVEGISTFRDREERSFGKYGTVIIFRIDSGRQIIHRAHFYVEAGENWYSEANQSYLRADSCNDAPNCPAPRSGYITKGDANQFYDQSLAMEPVPREAIIARATHRLPYLGYVALISVWGYGVLLFRTES